MDPLAGGRVESLVHTERGDGTQSGHPVVFTRLKKASVFRFCPRIFHLLDEGEPRVFIKIMPREGKMVVECPSLRVMHVVPVGVDA